MSLSIEVEATEVVVYDPEDPADLVTIPRAEADKMTLAGIINRWTTQVDGLEEEDDGGSRNVFTTDEEETEERG